MSTAESIQNTIDRYVSEGNIPRSLYWRGRLAALQEDWQTAVSMYRQASDRGDAYGTCELSHCYRNGNGVETDINRAHELALCAGEMNDYGGCYDVAKDFFDGVGLSRPDYAQAATWFVRASKCEETTPANCAVALLHAGDCCYKLGHYDEAMTTYTQAADLVKDDVKYARTYASCLDKAGFLSWHRLRYPLARDYWEKEQQVLYEYSKFDSSFDYDNDSNVDRVVKNVVIANSRIEGLLEESADIIGGLLVLVCLLMQ